MTNYIALPLHQPAVDHQVVVLAASTERLAVLRLHHSAADRHAGLGRILVAVVQRVRRQELAVIGLHGLLLRLLLKLQLDELQLLQR